MDDWDHPRAASRGGIVACTQKIGEFRREVARQDGGAASPEYNGESRPQFTVVRRLTAAQHEQILIEKRGEERSDDRREPVQ
jgi:hypothetical protein